MQSRTNMQIQPRQQQEAAMTIGIVASQYHLDYMQAMTECAYAELESLARGVHIQLVWAPGTYELPVLASVLAKQGACDAIIGFGLLFVGDTSHADLIASSVSHAFLQIAIETHVPILNGIVVASSPEIARVRCIEKEKNRGVEAARAAVSLVRTLKKLKKH